MAVFYLIRHAKPERAGTFLGQADPPLSPDALGALAHSISGLYVNIAYSSPLRRARETAACLRCSNVVVVSELREIGFGRWTGKTWAEIEEQSPDLARRKLQDWQGITPPDGERWGEFTARVQQAWDRIRGGPSPAAVVAHHAVNAVLANLAAGLPVSQFTQAYGEITELSYVAD
ncbi:MAG: histidine phosphatase family protein [Bryobacteraceae bacterium]